MQSEYSALPDLRTGEQTSLRDTNRRFRSCFSHVVLESA